MSQNELCHFGSLLGECVSQVVAVKFLAAFRAKTGPSH